MIDVLKDFYEAISVIDLIYLIITILSLITCYKKGFVLSILSMAKWLLAYVITLIIFPRVKPYFKNVIDKSFMTNWYSKQGNHFQKDLMFYPVSKSFVIFSGILQNLRTIIK